MNKTDITSALQSYVQDLEQRLHRCESDRERILLWHDASNLMNAVALELVGLAQIVAFTEIKSKTKYEQTK